MDEETRTNCTVTLSNTGNCSDDWSSVPMTPETIIVPVIFALLFVVGTTGNLLLIVFQALVRKCKTAHDIFVCNLAVGDTLMITMAMPFMSTIYTFTEWPYGDVICRISEFIQTFAAGLTVFTLAALSIERYIIVCVGSSSGRRHKPARLVISLIWIISLAIALPDAVSAQILHHESGSDFCIAYNNAWGDWYPKTNILLKFIVVFLIPLVVITPFYVILGVSLFANTFTIRRQTDDKGMQTSTPETEVFNQAPKEDAIRRRLGLAVIVIVLVIVFVISYLPRHIYLLWYRFSSHNFNQFWHIFKIISFCLFFSNSTLNPCIFGLLDTDFRTFVVSKLRCQTAKLVQARSTPDNQEMALTEYTHMDKTGDQM